MCKYEEIEGWRLSNGKTIREIKREKLTKTIKVLASFSLFIYSIQVSLLQNIDISLILYQFRI